MQQYEKSNITNSTLGEGGVSIKGCDCSGVEGFGNVQKTIKYKVEEDFFEDWHVWQYFSIRLSKT